MNAVVETSTAQSDTSVFNSALSIEGKLDAARVQLLDLSARNRLLNIPRSATRGGSSIDIVDERSAQVFKVLVAENRAMTFLPGRQSTDGNAATDEDSDLVELGQPDDSVDAKGLLNRHSDLRLQTRLTSKGLQKRLLNLYFDARTLEEEQGVNVLYLALGTLRWVDAKDATLIRHAPLVLVPVALERASAGDRFKLRWRQEDPSSNLSLEAMTDRTHALKLPAFDFNEELDVNAYCAAVAKAITSKPGWAVAADDMVLGFFSFSKFLMYRDLSADAWPQSNPIGSQPLIQALLRDGFSAEQCGVEDDVPLDAQLAPGSMLHIVDSDSSQSKAVQDVRQGLNLVIQGPPGTGKSQTIANIIAGAIADGKTVLFVAEKMAALDVVKRRLDTTGVGDACLELHSNKANKRGLLDELKRTWSLGAPRGSPATSLNHRLSLAQDELNSHVSRMHQVDVVAGVSAFHVVGQLTRLIAAGEQPNNLTLIRALEWSRDDLQERKNSLIELCERIEVIGQPNAHPWRGIELTSILPAQLTRLVNRVSILKSSLSDFIIDASALAKCLNQSNPSNFATLSDLRAFAARIASAPALAAQALSHSNWDEQRNEINHLIAIGKRAAAADNTLATLVHRSELETPVNSALLALNSLHETFSLEAFSQCHQLFELLPKLISEASKLNAQLGLGDDLLTLNDITRVTLTGQRVGAAPDASPDAFVAAAWDNGVEQAGELAEAIAKLESVRASVNTLVSPAAWSTDTQPARHMLRLKGKSLFRFFSGEWRRARHLVRSMVNDPTAPLDQLVALLDTVAEGQAALVTIRSGETLGRAAFGSDWQSDRSCSAPLRALVAWIRSLRGLGAAPRLIASRLPDRAGVAARASHTHQLLGNVRPLLEQLWGHLGASAVSEFEDAVSPGTAKLTALLDRAKAVASADATSIKVLIEPAATVPQRLMVLNQLQSFQQLVHDIGATGSLGQDAFGAFWDSHRSDWDTCTQAADWIDANQDIRMLAASLADRESPLLRANELVPRALAWNTDFSDVLSALDTDAQRVFGNESEKLPFTALLERLGLWIEHSEQLSRWVAYRERAGHADSLGLDDVVAHLGDGRLQPRSALSAFEMAYYEMLFSQLAKMDSALARFDGDLHSRKVQEFSDMDRERIAASRLDVLQAHHRRLPPRDGGFGPLGILRGEIGKRSRLIPIRQLMSRAGPAIQAIKPVFMMSPLSVAQFLTPGQLTFDLLVMDEASQIQPVDALGAIARCRQVVVVGDERQLPPTRFFSKLTSGDEDVDDDGAQVADMESILGLFTARGLPQRMLRWHYRSRHQSLIAVSNSQFYENKLIIVPSPFTKEAGMGLSFHHLPSGVFDSGGTGANAVEALEVAKAIVHHARTSPDHSLGVATFSVRQRKAILDQVEQLRRLNPDIEAFFDAHPGEPFFVKNLENVQGDERDVIIISVGYGRNANGVMSMRFGPLGADGGERRLNVLISRAKRRCEVYASITDEDIDLERARGKGVFAFKLFLRYARTGSVSLATDSPEMDSDVFEEQVAEALRGRGYQVHARVGIAGLFLDLAVADQAHPGRYILGIECDGPSYRDAQSARDRDRLRRSVLEDHGWMIHRIWSVDWLHRPNEELSKLVDAIERSKRALEHTQGMPRLRAVPAEVVVVERRDVTEIGLTGGSSDVRSYEQADIRALRKYPEIPDVPTDELALIVDQVAATEGPVHLDIVVQRIRDAWGKGRAGSKIQESVEKAVGLSVRAKRVMRQKNFLSIPGVAVVPRDRSGDEWSSLRKPELIASDELSAAVMHIVNRNFGVQQSEIATAVARLLGFASTSAGMRDAVAAQTRALVRKAILKEQNGFLRNEGQTADHAAGSPR